MSDPALHQDLVARDPALGPRPAPAPTPEEQADAERRRDLRSKRRMLAALFPDENDPLRVRLMDAFAALIDGQKVTGASRLRADLLAAIDAAPVDKFFSLGQSPETLRLAAEEVTRG